jgi:hypothetical protein
MRDCNKKRRKKTYYEKIKLIRATETAQQNENQTAGIEISDNHDKRGTYFRKLCNKSDPERP